MITLGLRCGTKEFSYSVVKGTADVPELLEVLTIKYPTGYTDPLKLKWFYQEIDGLIKKYEVKAIGIKSTEPVAMKGLTFGDRVEVESMVLLLAANHGIKYIKKKVNRTIAKDFGLKGKGKYLETGIDYSKIPEYKDKSKTQQEAILVSWSMLS